MSEPEPTHASSLGEAIRARQAAQAAQVQARPFEKDPQLEELGQRLDLVKEHQPDEYASAAYAGLKAQVGRYRIRKAEHERTQKR